MKKNVLSIDINKPVDFIFQFTVNPANTPKWVPSVIEEKTSEPDVKVGTIYYQKVDAGKGQPKRTSLVVTGFVRNKQLDFHLMNSEYTCSYRYEKTPTGTRLTYSEEKGVDGEIESPMTMENLIALKKLIEKN